MNFYLSAVEDQLRHTSAASSIGIILCKEKNAVIVEYALRDSTKPIGVAGYRLATSLPAQLQGDLPTATDLASQFPRMSVVRLRIEVERELRRLVQVHGIGGKDAGIRQLLHQLRETDIAPAIGTEFEAALSAMNKAVHGLNVDEESAIQAIEAGARLLAELKRL